MGGRGDRLQPSPEKPGALKCAALAFRRPELFYSRASSCPLGLSAAIRRHRSASRLRISALREPSLYRLRRYAKGGDTDCGSIRRFVCRRIERGDRKGGPPRVFRLNVPEKLPMN